jgi:hypothetical protein
MAGSKATKKEETKVTVKPKVVDKKSIDLSKLKDFKNKNGFNEDVKDKYEHKFQQLESKFKYLVNHTKKEFVDKSKVPNVDGWRAHPLPLLTCEGNEEGNGDYYSEDGKEFIGVWSRDLISVESIKPKGYTEIKPDFKE